jgi:hypothetical protein
MLSHPHLPDLHAIRSSDNQEMRFYAIVGAVISLGGALEVACFEIFRHALGLSEKHGASIFYKVESPSGRRDTAEAAMSAHLEGRPTELKEWNVLFARIKGLTGRVSDRNLLGHNIVHREFKKVPGFAAPSHSLLPAQIPFALNVSPMWFGEWVFAVSQDETQASVSGRKQRRADFDALFKSAEEAKAVVLAVADFLNGL